MALKEKCFTDNYRCIWSYIPSQAPWFHHRITDSAASVGVCENVDLKTKKYFKIQKFHTACFTLTDCYVYLFFLQKQSIGMRGEHFLHIGLKHKCSFFPSPINEVYKLLKGGGWFLTQWSLVVSSLAELHYVRCIIMYSNLV